MLTRDFLDGVRRPHSDEGICGPHAFDKFREEFWLPGHNCGNVVRAADGSAIVTVEESEDLYSRHRVLYSAVTPFKKR